MNARPRFIRWQWTLVTLAGVPLLATAWPLEAAPKPLAPRSGTVPYEPPEDAGVATTARNVAMPVATTMVKLNHMRSSWSKVLKELADGSNKQLVADVVPAGNFTRWDMREHTPEDAIRILNHDLEPRGFRLQIKGEHLVLIELKKTRREYQPAVIPSEKSVADEANEEEPVETGRTERLSAELPQRSARSASDRRGQRRSPVEQAGYTDRGRNQVQQVSAEHEERPVTEQTTGESELTVVRLKARDAVAVSRIMYNAFKPRAERIDDGPRGLQGFRVLRLELDQNGRPAPPRGQAAVRFSVGIDEDRNQLVIDAAPHETPSLLKLIRTLDVLPGEGTVRAVSTTKDAGQIASALQPELDRLTAASKKAERRARLAQLERTRRGEEVAEAGEEQPEATEPRAPRRRGAEEPPEEMERPGGAQGLIQSLKGDVQVESIPELGIMVIIGNERDAETVVNVIKQIEELSKGAIPEVELVLLKHVNSEALASLLTNVYERLSPSRRAQGGQAQAQQNVLVIPVVRPNAILIVAARVDIDSAKELAEQLDQPSDPRTEHKVIRLKYAIPTRMVEQVEAIYGAGAPAAQGRQQQQSTTARGALSPKVNIIADPRTNSVIVQAQPRDMREVVLLIRELDVEESGSVTQIRIFPLNTAVADELAATLQTAILSLLNPARVIAPQGGQGQQQFQGGQQGPEELRDVKSTILQFMDERDGEGRMLQSGILADIRITADMRTNSVVVTAPEQSMELMAKLIDRFDKPNAAVAEIKVFTMEKGDAQATLNLLNGLFGVQGQRPGGGGGQFGQNFPGLITSNADDASSTLVPLRFTVDVRTNSIIAIGSPAALEVVDSVILTLDASEVSQRKTEVYTLKNTPAADVANAISLFLQTQRQVETADPGLVSPFEQIEREVIVVPEPVSNNLLISATPRFFPDIMKLVIDIDRAPQQVLIQGLLVEVQLDNADEWGVELGLQDSVLFDRSLVSTVLPVTTTFTNPNGNQTQNQTIISATAAPGYAFGNPSNPNGNNVAQGINTSTVGAQGLSSFSLGRVNTELGYGGLVLSAGSESVSALLRAVATRRRVDVLSRPQIRTLDNQQARIQVGQEIPRVGNFQLNTVTGTAQPIVEQRGIGIMLMVWPRITPDGKVVMNVQASKDALSRDSVPLVTNPDGSTINSPIIDTTNAIATVSVQSGQTIVLGGMITKRDDNVERKVPLLGDIPVLGQAFRYDFKRMVRTELLIFLTPRVITSDAESERIKEVEAQRINFIEAEAEMIHGPLYGIESPVYDFTKPPEAIPHDQSVPSLPRPANVPPPLPPAPGISPMSLEADEYDDVPTTLMPAHGLPEEDLDNIDLSRKKTKSSRKSSVMPAGFDAADVPVDAPTRTPARSGPSLSPPVKSKTPPRKGPKPQRKP